MYVAVAYPVSKKSNQTKAIYKSHYLHHLRVQLSKMNN